MKERSTKHKPVKPQPTTYRGVPNYNELARRIIAAIISHIGGLASVDRTLKQYVAPVVDDSWCAEARRLQAKLMAQRDRPKRLSL